MAWYALWKWYFPWSKRDYPDINSYCSCIIHPEKKVYWRIITIDEYAAGFYDKYGYMKYYSHN